MPTLRFAWAWHPANGLRDANLRMDAMNNVDKTGFVLSLFPWIIVGLINLLQPG